MDSLSTKKPSHNTSLNLLTLFAYFGLLIFQMRRYYLDNDFRIYILVMTLLLYGILVLICLYKIIYYARFNYIYSIISSIALLLSLWLCLYKANYSITEIISHWPSLFTTIMLIISMYDISLDDIVSTFFITVGTLFIVRLVAETIIVLYSNMTPINISEGLTLGFGNHNFPMVLLFFLVLSWIYLSRNRSNRILDSILIICITCVLFFFTRSKTSTMLLLITSALIIIQSIANLTITDIFKTPIIILKKIASIFALISPILLVIISFGGTVIYNYYVTTHLDQYDDFRGKYTILSRFLAFSHDFAYNRIWLPFQFQDVPPAETYTLIPFSPITGGDLYASYSDNVCHYLIINYGFIVFTLFVLGYLLLSFRVYKKQSTSLMIILGLISIFCIMERSSLLYFANPFLLALFSNISTPASDYALKSNSFNKIRKTNRLSINKVLLLIYALISSLLLAKSIICLTTNHTICRTLFLWVTVTSSLILYYYYNHRTTSNN